MQDVQNWHATKVERPKPMPKRSMMKSIGLLARAMPNTAGEVRRRVADRPRRGPMASQMAPIATRAAMVPDTATIPAAAPRGVSKTSRDARVR